MMFKPRLLGLLLIAFSTPSIAMKLTWDDTESGTGLHIFSKGNNSQQEEWTVREARTTDTPFYQNLFSDIEVVKTMNNGKEMSAEETEKRVTRWVNGSSQGYPFSGMLVEQNNEPVGYVQLYASKNPGVGLLARALKTSVQGKGLGKAVLGFLVNEWAPTVRQIGLGQDTNASSAVVKKFNCFNEAPLHLIYATARPSNPASWQCYKHFGFYPSQPTDTTREISCEGWEESLHGPLEDYIVNQHFSPQSSDLLHVDVLYKMLDETGTLRTISFVERYESLRYHFEREVR